MPLLLANACVKCVAVAQFQSTKMKPRLYPHLEIIVLVLAHAGLRAYEPIWGIPATVSVGSTCHFACGVVWRFTAAKARE